MDESLLAGLLLMAIALPVIGLGVAILIGKIRPAQLAAARHPQQARIASGAYLVLVNLLILVLGALMVLAPAMQEPIARWGVAVVIGAATFGLVPLLRAVRA